MTTTVKVKARAHGAIVSIARGVSGTTETVEVEANTKQEFHLTESDSITVVEGKAPAAEPELSAGELATGLSPTAVPGRVENDALLSGGDPKAPGRETSKSPVTS